MTATKTSKPKTPRWMKTEALEAMLVEVKKSGLPLYANGKHLLNANVRCASGTVYMENTPTHRQFAEYYGVAIQTV